LDFRSDDENNELDDVDEKSDKYDSEAYDDVGSLNNEDTKSRFTDYSMSSSIIRRNENLKLLDDKFEQVIFLLYFVFINAIIIKSILLLDVCFV